MLGRQVPSTEPHPLPPDGTFKNDMMRMSILPACQGISGASSDCEGRRTVSDPRGTRVIIVVKHHVGIGN